MPIPHLSAAAIGWLHTVLKHFHVRDVRDVRDVFLLAYILIILIRFYKNRTNLFLQIIKICGKDVRLGKNCVTLQPTTNNRQSKSKRTTNRQ
jgi:hypothetical protein